MHCTLTLTRCTLCVLSPSPPDALHTLHASGRKHASLGGGVLPCAGATSCSGLDFELPLCRHGAVVGSLRGQLRVELGEEAGGCDSWVRRLLRCCTACTQGPSRLAESAREMH